MGQYQFVDVMTLYPQRDILENIQNQNGQEPVLDLGFQIEGWGQVYIHPKSFSRVAEMFEYMPIAEHLEIRNRASERIEELLLENEELRRNLGQVPATIERLLHGLHELSVSAVGDLLSIGGVGGDDAVGADAEGREGDPEGTAPASD